MSLETVRRADDFRTPWLRRVLKQRETSLVGVGILLFALFSLLSSRFSTAANVNQILVDMSIVVIVGIGEAVVLFTRNIDVSIGSMVGFSAFFTADFASKNPQLPMIIVVLVACLIGLILGSINGIIVSTFAVPSIMVTLGTLYVYRGLDSMLAGSNQVTAQNLSSQYNDIASWTLFGIPSMFVYAVVVGAIVHTFIRRTMHGRSMLALGSNPAGAVKIGIPTKRLVFAAFALSGTLCGLAGVLWGARYGTVDSSVASGFELTVLAAVVVGGVSVNGGSGSIPGVFAGAAILSIIAIGLSLVNISQFWILAIQGAVIIVAITVDALARRRIEAQGGSR